MSRQSLSATAVIVSKGRWLGSFEAFFGSAAKRWAGCASPGAGPYGGAKSVTSAPARCQPSVTRHSVSWSPARPPPANGPLAYLPTS